MSSEIRAVHENCSQASEEKNDFMKELVNVASLSHVNTRTQAAADWDSHSALKVGLNTGAKMGPSQWPRSRTALLCRDWPSMPSKKEQEGRALCSARKTGSG